VKRHHYELNAPGAAPRRFHVFAEANQAVAEVLENARGDGQPVSEDGYWRWTLGGQGGSGETVALDDAGLVPCGEDCG
jgi:hypothetical protein